MVHARARETREMVISLSGWAIPDTERLTASFRATFFSACDDGIRRLRCRLRGFLLLLVFAYNARITRQALKGFKLVFREDLAHGHVIHFLDDLSSFTESFRRRWSKSSKQHQ